MKRIFLPLITIFLLVAFLLVPDQAKAQDIDPYVVDTTIAVDPGIRADVDAWLAISAPIPLPYWAITYVQEMGLMDTFVSIVALNIASPTDKWSMTEGDSVVWMGSVIVHADGTVDIYSDNPYNEQTSTMKLAMPALGPGGGVNVRFPWQAGGTMMYGVRGIHAAGGGGSYATGFSAVDFVGGDDMGSGVASPSVYAVDTGTVDYVCMDDTTTLVRTANGDSYYIYAHLLDNANLVASHAFTQGSLIGSLKYGSFDDDCGWAEQTSKHYHLHFGFEPANGAFRMEGCILSMSTKKWTCGTEIISTGQFLKGGGGISGVGDDGGMSIVQPGFFDYILAGMLHLWDIAVIQHLPSHEALPYIYVVYNSVKLVLKMGYVLVYSNINLFYIFTAIYWGFSVKIFFGLAEMFMFLWKAIKSLVPLS